MVERAEETRGGLEGNLTGFSAEGNPDRAGGLGPSDYGVLKSSWLV